MNQSDQIDKWLKAVSAMHKEFGVVLSADTKGVRSNYAKLDGTLEQIDERAAKHGLLLTREGCMIDGKPGMRATLFHIESGQYRFSESQLTPSASNPSPDQGWGGSTTYHARYNSMDVCGVFAAFDPSDNDSEAPAPKQNSYATTQATQFGEPTHSGRPAGAVSDKQLGLLKMKIGNNKSLETQVCKAYSVPELGHLPWQKMNEALALIEKGSQIGDIF